MIYYHFKGKEEILDVLIQGFIREYTELIQIAEHDTHQTKAENLTQRAQEHYRDFAIKNTDLIRIIFIDSLKKSTKQPIIYQIVTTMIDTDEKFAIAESPNEYNRNERLIAEFFTNIIPMYAFLCFHDSWIDYFGIEKKEFGALFLKIYAATHGAYHKYHE